MCYTERGNRKKVEEAKSAKCSFKSLNDQGGNKGIMPTVCLIREILPNQITKDPIYSTRTAVIHKKEEKYRKLDMEQSQWRLLKPLSKLQNTDS